jgi:hypothetical protein
MYPLKPLSKEAIPAALTKAERYRLLNEPTEAESICLDVLQVDPRNQQAIVMLILSLTDQFPHGSSSRAITRAGELAAQLQDPYEQAYYSGIIRERRAKAALQRGQFGSSAIAVEWLRDAMTYFERAEKIRPPQNDAVLLRWNACARLLMNLPAASEGREAEAVQSE